MSGTLVRLILAATGLVWCVKAMRDAARRRPESVCWLVAATAVAWMIR